MSSSLEPRQKAQKEPVRSDMPQMLRMPGSVLTCMLSQTHGRHHSTPPDPSSQQQVSAQACLFIELNHLHKA